VVIGNSVLSEAYSDQVKISRPTENLNEPDHRANLFTFQSITNEQVYNALIAINTAKAKGADDISAKAIRLVAGQIAPSVAYLFSEPFRLGTFPSAWKQAVYHHCTREGTLPIETTKDQTLFCHVYRRFMRDWQTCSFKIMLVKAK
jgi:hypothetical protein